MSIESGSRREYFSSPVNRGEIKSRLIPLLPLESADQIITRVNRGEVPFSNQEFVPDMLPRSADVFKASTPMAADE